MAVQILVLLAAPAARAAFVDAVLAELDTGVVTASEIALARALRLFGLQPAPAPITAEEVDRFAAGQLMAREAEELDIGAPAEAVEAAWHAAGAAAGGGAALTAWLDRIGVSQAWARRLLAAHLRRLRFIEVRFRSFAFVSEFDVDEALGPGEHPPAAREAVRSRLLEAQVEASLAEWLTEARERRRLRLLIREPVPVPFGMPEGLKRET